MAHGNNVFESFPLDAPLRTGDAGMQKMSHETHLSVLDDLHDAHKDLVPSFAHASPGMRESFANATKELSDLSIIGMNQNAGARFASNNDAINKFFNGGHSQDVAAQADGSFDNFIAGRSSVAATHIDTTKNRLNNNYAQG
jgi:hypothetical protein